MTSHQGSAGEQRQLRIILADDHRVVRRGLQMVLDAEPDFTVVDQAGDVDAVHSSVREHRPDVLVLDLNMPGGSVLDAIPRLRAESPATQIVVLTMETSPAAVRAVREAGALGFVLKDAADSELADAVRRVAAGERYLNRRMASKLIAERIRTEPSD